MREWLLKSFTPEVRGTILGVMANTPAELSQRATALEKFTEKLEARQDKLGEKLHGLSDRVEASEFKVDQIHGIGKWVVPTVIVLLLSIAGEGLKITHDIGQLEGKISQNESASLSRSLQSVLLSSDPRSAIAQASEALKQAHAGKVKLEPDLVSKVGQRAVDLGVEDPRLEPESWRAAVEAISYKTDVLEGLDTVRRARRMQQCSSLPPTINTTSDPPGVNYKQSGPFLYKDCVLNLDNPGLPAVVTTGTAGVQCSGCIVEYSRRGIFFKAEFRNCDFILRQAAHPSAPALLFARDVLSGERVITIG